MVCGRRRSRPGSSSAHPQPICSSRLPGSLRSFSLTCFRVNKSRSELGRKRESWRQSAAWLALEVIADVATLLYTVAAWVRAGGGRDKRPRACCNTPSGRRRRNPGVGLGPWPSEAFRSASPSPPRLGRPRSAARGRRGRSRAAFTFRARCGLPSPPARPPFRHRTQTAALLRKLLGRRLAHSLAAIARAPRIPPRKPVRRVCPKSVS